MMPTASSFLTVRFVLAITKSHFQLFQPSSLNVGGGVRCRYRSGASFVCIYYQPEYHIPFYAHHSLIL